MSIWENIYAAGEQLNRYPYAEVVSFTKRLVRKTPLIGKTALDIGCGSGVHANFLAEEGMKVVAFDGSHSAIKHAKVLHGHSNIEYQVSNLIDFAPTDRQFSLTIDRLASTYARIDELTNFYQRLKSSLAPDARLLWQGFDMDNTGRTLGTYDDTLRQWTGFSHGVFPKEDRLSFFSEDDLKQVFEGYTVVSKRILSDLDLETGYRHSYWNLELSFGALT
jgi:cyclopropane fatty-acyl-phospholipid synthase-like methyltransferase